MSNLTYPEHSDAVAGLRILATSDLHASVTGYDYYANRVSFGTGLTRVATLIRQARAEAAAENRLCLLVDNGDALAGAPMDILSREPDRTHPVIKAFRHLGYDAMGLGNHDFDLGLPVLARAIKEAPCPVLSSNLRTLEASAGLGVKSQVILRRQVASPAGQFPISIGILSVLPPQTLAWNARQMRGVLVVDDILETVARHVAALRQDGAELVVVLAHTGLDRAPAHRGMENAVIPLAEIPGIDAVVAGHTHLQLPGQSHAGLRHVDAGTGHVHGVPTVMPGASGSHLGLIDLTLERGGNASWHIRDSRSALRGVMNGARVPVAEDRDLSELVAPLHAETVQRLEEPVGHCAHSLHSYFCFIGEDRGLQMVAAAQAAAIRPFLHKETGTEDLPVISVSAPSKFGGRAGPQSFTDIPAGKLTRRNVADLNTFHNYVAAMILPGARVMAWVNHATRRFQCLKPGEWGQELLNPEFPGHNFDVFFGLEYEIDLSRPVSRTADARMPPRVAAAKVWGTPLAKDQDVIVVVNSYRADGGGDVAALAGARQLAVPKISVRDAIERYVADGTQPDPIAAAPWPWRFAPLPGASAVLRTGPGARTYRQEQSVSLAEFSEPHADGFVTVTVTL